MVQNSSPTGDGLNPGAWAGVGIGAAGCIFVFCMWIFRWSKRSRDNIVRGRDAIGKVKMAFGIGVHHHHQGANRGKGPRVEMTGLRQGKDEEVGEVKKGEVGGGKVEMPGSVAEDLMRLQR